MDLESREKFLIELHHQTDGDTEKQVAMHDVGLSLGMEKSMTGSLAEDMIMDGLVELKTLSGGIGITQSGIEFLEEKGVVHGRRTQAVLSLSGEVHLNEEDRQNVEQLMSEIRSGLTQGRIHIQQAEELVIDIKTVEIQMLSPAPKTAVIRELFRAIHNSLVTMNMHEIAKKMGSIV